MAGKALLKRLHRHFFLPLIFLLVGAVASSLFLIDTAKEMNANSDWYGTPNGLDESFFVNLGGHQQFVRIRSRNRNHPVILYLHGGPGGATSHLSYRLARPFTDYFTFVEWDQRGSGKSRIDDALLSTMTYEQLVDDTVELIEVLRSRLQVEQVILMGQSWGSMLGMGVIQQRPDLISVYLGVGQGVAWNAGLDESARLVLSAAQAANDQATVAALKALPENWPPVADRDAYYQRIVTIQSAVVKYGKSFHAAKDYDKTLSADLALDGLLSPRLSLAELLSSDEYPNSALDALIKDLNDRDFRQQFGHEFQVPMVIFQGEHDWITPTSLVKPWFEKLQTPHKEYVAFEHSGHWVLNEEQGKFIYELVSRVRPFGVD